MMNDIDHDSLMENLQSEKQLKIDWRGCNTIWPVVQSIRTIAPDREEDRLRQARKLIAEYQLKYRNRPRKNGMSADMQTLIKQVKALGFEFNLVPHQ